MKHKRTWHLWLVFILVMLLALLIPILIQNNFKNVAVWIRYFTNAGSGNDWLQFWGSYLGTLISIPVTVTLALLTIRYEQRNEIEQNEIKRKNIEYNNIMKFSTKYQVEVQTFMYIDFENTNNISYQNIASVKKIANDLFNTDYKEFRLQINLSLAKLSEDERHFIDNEVNEVSGIIKDSQEDLININTLFNEMEYSFQEQKRFEEANNDLGHISYDVIAQSRVKEFCELFISLRDSMKDIPLKLNEVTEKSLKKTLKSVA